MDQIDQAEWLHVYDARHAEEPAGVPSESGVGFQSLVDRMSVKDFLTLIVVKHIRHLIPLFSHRTLGDVYWMRRTVM